MNAINVNYIEDNAMYCYGCMDNCEYTSAQTRNKDECKGMEFYVWPEVNPFFTKGVLQCLTDVDSKMISQPVVVVDFSYKNLNHFLTTCWLSYFRGTRLILIADKTMSSIANYWFCNDTTDTVISAIIFHDDTTDDIKAKFSQSLMGKIIRPSEKRAKLSANEYALLVELYKGQLPKKIAMKNATSVKSIYAMKIRLEKKLGVPILRLVN